MILVYWEQLHWLFHVLRTECQIVSEHGCNSDFPEQEVRKDVVGESVQSIGSLDKGRKPRQGRGPVCKCSLVYELGKTLIFIFVHLVYESRERKLQ